MRTVEQKQGSQKSFSANIFSFFFWNHLLVFGVGGGCAVVEWSSQQLSCPTFFPVFNLLLNLLIFLQDLKSNLAQMCHEATSITWKISSENPKILKYLLLPHLNSFLLWRDSKVITLTVTIWTGGLAGYMWEALCERVCACISPCMHACVGMAVHAFLAGRHLWQTKKALYPCCGMALSFSRAPAAQHSLCPCIQASCPWDMMNGCHDNAKCTLPPYQKSQNVALVFVVSLLSITVPCFIKICRRALQKSTNNDLV